MSVPLSIAFRDGMLYLWLEEKYKPDFKYRIYMEGQRHLEITGYIQKVEKLAVVSANIIPGTLVMENSDPYPGYFGENLPDDQKPRSIFLALHDHTSPEQVARWVMNAKKGREGKCRANYAEILVFNEWIPCIRITGIECFPNIREMQVALQHEEVRFKKSMPVEDEGLIKVYKTVLLNPIEENLFLDVTDPAKYYFPISQKPGWNTFCRITRSVKANTSIINFDAALGIFFRYSGMQDVIRIYDPYKDPTSMISIRDRYYYEFQNLIDREVVSYPL